MSGLSACLLLGTILGGVTARPVALTDQHVITSAGLFGRHLLTVCKFACAKTYAPVCGSDKVTYDNKCYAVCHNAEVAWEGTCSPGNTRRMLQQDGPYADVATSEAVNMCTTYYSPVCDSTGKLHINKCYAVAANATVTTDRGCIVAGAPIPSITAAPSPGAAPAPAKACPCGRDYRPVCDATGVVHPNPCTAQCNGAVIVSEGPCPGGGAGPDMGGGAGAGMNGGAGGGFACTLEYSPVCGMDGQKYPNRCNAEKGAGVKVAHAGECA